MSQSLFALLLCWTTPRLCSANTWQHQCSKYCKFWYRSDSKYKASNGTTNTDTSSFNLKGQLMGKQSISIYKANVINLQIPLNKSTLGRLLFFKCNRQGRDTSCPTSISREAGIGSSPCDCNEDKRKIMDGWNFEFSYNFWRVLNFRGHWKQFPSIDLTWIYVYKAMLLSIS